MRDHLLLENGLVRFAFDRTTGSIAGTTDRTTGQQHIGDPARGRLFRVVCPGELWMSRYADSHQATRRPRDAQKGLDFSPFRCYDYSILKGSLPR